MPAVGNIASPICQPSAAMASAHGISTPKICVSLSPSYPNSAASSSKIRSFSVLSPQDGKKNQTIFSPKAASLPSVGSLNYTEEPTTNVKFQKSLNIPGCSTSLSLLGAGFREKYIGIIGIKVYAVALYVNPFILNELSSWKGQSAAKIQGDLSLFELIHQSPSEKSLQLAMVRDIDAKTFWDALDEAVSPRVKAPTPADESALSNVRSIFGRRPLRKGTLIFLTWLQPSQTLVSVSSNGLSSGVDATIESANVTRALFDVFFGHSPVSPSLKASVASGLATIL
ncbi:Fatty-acid-binding protein 3, chloroplastic [Ancistrocladus abbreviatus]